MSPNLPEFKALPNEPAALEGEWTVRKCAGFRSLRVGSGSALGVTWDSCSNLLIVAGRYLWRLLCVSLSENEPIKVGLSRTPLVVLPDPPLACLRSLVAP